MGALIGLAGAVNNNGKTGDTDRVVRQALLAQDAEEAIRLIHEEKHAVSPGCASCQSPCGNTSDYEPARFDLATEPIRRIREQVMEALGALALREPLPEVVYKAIAYLGYDLTEETYRDLLKEMDK